jgi:multiphosphoryl transfer protein
MAEEVLSGSAASPGIGAGPAHLLDPRVVDDGSCAVPLSERSAELERAETALSDAAAAVKAVARTLQDQGRAEDAEIVETGALLAADPTLLKQVRTEVREHGRSAAGAILEAADNFAEAIADLDDPMLAARADDIRSVARRAARLAVGAGAAGPAADGWSEGILVASDLGPADVAELGSSLSGVALAAGGVTAHASIVARSLGIPMVVGLGDRLMQVAEGDPIVIDGGEGIAVRAPTLARAAHARLAGAARARAQDHAAERRELPAVTTDGREIRVLTNVATPAELGVALGAGAEGIGLLRTELAFLEARAWPDRSEHERVLAPVLGALGPRVATVRLLDFGGDKTPPFLRGTDQRGIQLQLDAPEALDAQLQAVLATATEGELRLLLPMVGDPSQLDAVRDALRGAVDAVPGAAAAQVGAMIETAEGVENARRIAEAADFLSIGTNDLAASILGQDRFSGDATGAQDPRVLAAIDAVARAAEDWSLSVEVCGEAASDPGSMPLLVGLGIGELSVGAARVGEVRAWVRALTQIECTALARRALRAPGAAEVATLTEPIADQLGSAEFRDAAGERVNGSASIVSLGSDN